MSQKLAMLTNVRASIAIQTTNPFVHELGVFRAS